jgi:hypothetical protein
MYTDLRSLWERFSKNAVEILGDDIATGAVAMAGLIFSWTALALSVWSAHVLAGGPSAPATLGFGLCLVGSLAVFGVHLGTARHCRIPLWFGVVSGVLRRCRHFGLIQPRAAAGRAGQMEGTNL